MVGWSVESALRRADSTAKRTVESKAASKVGPSDPWTAEWWVEYWACWKVLTWE